MARRALPGAGLGIHTHFSRGAVIMIGMIDITGWFTAVFASAGRAMSLDPGGAPPLTIALGIAFFAGVSTLLGHGAVLYINRIKGLRGVAALALSGALLVALYVVQAAILYVVAPLATGTHLPLATVTAVALTSTAPMLFGIFEFVPVLGLLLGKLLSAWGFVVLWALIVTAYGTSPLGALIAGGAGWFIMHLFSILLGPQLARATGRVWQWVTGVPTEITVRDILSGTPLIPVSPRLLATPREEVS